MKLHSDVIAYLDLRGALSAAQDRGRVARDIEFVRADIEGSRSRRMGYEVQLGTEDKTSGPTGSRRYKNSGVQGAGSVWAATYDEWGWFIAELFEVDADAVVGPYKGIEDFHTKTEGRYR